VADLEAAVRKLRAAQAGVPRAEERAARLVAEAREKVDQARAELAEAIRAAARAGMRQRDIVAVTGYSRERVRQIVGES
jgi:CRP-like cAMP-binding protein